MLKKSLTIGAYIVVAVALALFRGPLIQWMSSDTVWYMDMFTWLAGLLIAIVPAIPYGIVAVVIGAKYGAIMGVVINILISVLAAVILFVYVRVTFSEEERSKFANKRGVIYFTAFAERNAFIAILFARLLPILPAQAITIFAAITRIPWKPYLIATILGKIPFMLLVTLLGNQFLRAPDLKGMIVTVCIYGLFLLVVYAIYKMNKWNPMR